MRVKTKTIKLAKIRRLLRKLARTKYDWDYSSKMEKDITKMSQKVYKISRSRSD